jgi:hypothetical protein
MEADFIQFVNWVFYGVMGGGVFLGIKILSKMSDSIADLNTKVALVIEKTSSHEEQIAKALNKIDEQQNKIIILETKQGVKHE